VRRAATGSGAAPDPSVSLSSDVPGTRHMAPRRVLITAWAPFFSGAERALLLTLRALDKRRHAPVLVVGTDGELAALARQAEIEVHVCPLRQLDRRHFPSWLGSVGRLYRIAGRVRPDLVHANDVPSFQPGGYVARWLRLPAITHVRFPFEPAAFGWFLRPGFARALFVSDALRREVTTAAPALFGDRSEVLYDGVEIPPLPSAEERRALRASLDLPQHTPVVALTGQVAEVKGIWEFVDAARLIGERRVDAVFAVLGDDLRGNGALRLAMEARVKELGLTSRFRFLGFRRDASRLIAAFDIVAVPSHVEPLGNATLEAMAAGVPVVGSRVGGIPEMIIDKMTGQLVPPRDPAALAQALEPLLLDAGRRVQLGRAALARARDTFSLSSHAARLHGVYDDVLGADSMAGGASQPPPGRPYRDSGA
jgi:glycosyltransferase involved in cell wall biosynthesis